MFKEGDVLPVFLDLIILVVIYYNVRPVIVEKKELPNKRLIVSISSIVFFCLFSFWSGDWYHYRELFDIFKTHPNVHSHMEDVYLFLIREICPIYLVFRLLIWGGALLMYYFTIKLTSINQSIVWAILGVGFLPFFAYARVSICLAFILLGVSIIYKQSTNYKFLHFIIGLILIFISFFFHKTAFFGIAVILFSFFVPQTNKNSWFYLILVFIIGSVVFKYIFQEIVSIDFSDESGVASRASRIKNSVHGNFYLSRGVGPMTTMFAEHIPYFLTAYLAFKIQNEYEVPKKIMTIIKFNFYIVLFSLTFLFDLGANTGILYGRFLRFSILPCVITLAYAYQYNLFKKLTFTSIVFAAVGTIYQFIYAMYCNYMNL